MSEKHPNSRADNPNSQSNLVKGDHTRPIGGAISRATRSRAGQLYELNLDLIELMFTRFRENDPSVKARDVHEAMDKLYKWSGSDVQKHALTDTQGNDLAPAHDPAALDAMLAARQAHLAEGVKVREALPLPPSPANTAVRGNLADEEQDA